MTTKFTKGEWDLSLDFGDKTLIHCGDNVICEGILCSFNKVETEPHRIEAMANAHLIKTSPKLYKELQDLADWLEYREDYKGWYKRVCDVLSEARGEEY